MAHTTKASEIFDGILTDLKATIDYHPDGRDLIPTLFDYIEQMRVLLWETAFFRKFGVEKAIQGKTTLLTSSTCSNRPYTELFTGTSNTFYFLPRLFLGHPLSLEVIMRTEARISC